MSKQADRIREAAAVFDALHTAPALIGGLALAAHHVVRGATSISC